MAASRSDLMGSGATGWFHPPLTSRTWTCRGPRSTGRIGQINQNILYATDSYKSWDLTFVRSGPSFAVGQLAAKSGLASGYTTGYITRTYVEYSLIPANGTGSLPHHPTCTFAAPNNCPMGWGMAATYDSAGGDSGSPVYSWDQTSPSMQHTLLGFHSARYDDDERVFAPAYAAKDALDLDFFCTTAGCP